jgi:putative cardiolipin synthase
MNSALRLAGVSLALLLGGCMGTMQPVESPVELTPPPTEASHWQALETVREGNWFHVLNLGGEAFDWRLRAIDSAVESIDLQTFIWDLDAAGHQVREHLLAAAERGVLVRVLVDDSFILDADNELLALDSHPGIELKVYNPYKRRSSNAALRQVLNLGEFHRLDHRMHNKVMVVDNRAAIVGGRNIASQYFGYHEANNFRDMELVAGGPVVVELANAFDSYWNDRWSFPVAAVLEQRAAPGQPRPVVDWDTAKPAWHQEETANERLQAWLELAGTAHEGSAQLLLDQPPDNSPAEADEAPVQVGEALVTAIDSAESDIWLISAYLIPTPELTDAIRKAEQRGAQVRILTNSLSSNNHVTAHSAYRNHIRELIELGAELHELRDDAADRHAYIESPVEEKSLCLHAKVVVIDNDQVFVGSANLDSRSLRLNTEMGLFIESASLNAEMRQALEPDFAPRNAWRVELDPEGQMIWVGDDVTLKHQPSHHFMRRIEDWFLSLLPIEDEM